MAGSMLKILLFGNISGDKGYAKINKGLQGWYNKSELAKS